MNAASTVPAAYAVTPKTKESCRTQSTWYASPQAPEQKNNTRTSGIRLEL
jgi:hypothetical protein